MDLLSNGVHLQKILHEICSFFMKIFKDNEIPSLPEFILINELYPNEQKFKIISFLISAAIDVFSSLPHKNIQLLVGSKIGLWRTLLVKMCLLNGADIHHLPLEIDIIASRNKLVIESLIFNWPFCNIIVSDLLEYLCDSFHGSNNVSQPYIDDYAVKFKPSHKKTEIMNCIALGLKWVHAVQGSPNYSYTKDVLKGSIINLILVSDIVMKNREGQFDEVWNEICVLMDSFEEFESTRIDSYPLYCALNPLLKTLSDFIRTLFVVETSPDFSKVISGFHDVSEKYESREVWGSELTNTMLTALNTVMTEMLFRKCKSFPKISENNLKMFINAVAVSESVSQVILMSEVNYWIDRLKRKKIELPINLGDFFSGVWAKTAKESTFVTNLEEYFLKVLQNDPGIKQVPALIGSSQVISDNKSFQKLVINCLKNSCDSFLGSDLYIPPVLDSKVTIISTIVERMADHYELKLASHFKDKIARVIEKLNTSIIVPITNNPDMDDKSLIIPVLDTVDYKLFVAYIWRCVDLSNPFLMPINIQEYLIDIRHELFSQIHINDADRIISRLMFFIGWRFKFRATELLSDELFRFHLVFNFLGENLDSMPLIHQNLCFWMRMLPSYDHSKYNNAHQIAITFQSDEFFQCSKLDNVKNHILQILRGVKNISIPQLSDVNFPRYKRGLESTKAILLILRQVFGKLNESDRHKNDTGRYWLRNIKALETELSIICCKLDADSNQVLGELNFLVDIIRTSVYGDVDCKKREYGRRNEIAQGEEDILSKSVSSKHGSSASTKIENASSHDSQSHKRKSYSSKDDNAEQMLNKVPRLSYDYDDDTDDDKESLTRRPTFSVEKPTLQSKVNFIDNSSDIAPGDMIESRISYINEPSPKSICIDAGKGKSRPPRFVEIESRPNRNPITVLKRPQGILKLADFGNARFLTKDVNLDNSLIMTPKIVSYLYRAPEILLDYETYGTEVDIWSAGCVVFEVLTGNKLFTTKKCFDESNTTMLDFLDNIARIVGSPNQSVWPTINQSKHFVNLATSCIAINYSRKIDEFMKTIPFDAADVLKQIFQWDPKKRLGAKSALNSNWLQNVDIQSILVSEFPDKDCHEYLLDNGAAATSADIEQENVSLQDSMETGSCSKLEPTCVNYQPLLMEDGSGSKVANHSNNIDEDGLDEPLRDEELKQFVHSLTGKILELNDILERLRKEPAYTPEICKGIIMRAAREWSGRERMRLYMVPFMLDYLLKPDEKLKLHL